MSTTPLLRYQAYHPLAPDPPPLRRDPSNSIPLFQPPIPAPTTRISHGRHLDGTGGRMLGLRLASSRRGGWLRLVGMELRGMVWIGLVNSGYSRKEEENQCQPHWRELRSKARGEEHRTHHRGLGA